MLILNPPIFKLLMTCRRVLVGWSALLVLAGAASLAVGLTGRAAPAVVEDWQRLGPSQDAVLEIGIDPATPRTLYAATSGGVFRSNNRGGRFNEASLGLGSLGAQSGELLVLGPGKPVLFYRTLVGLFRSANRGGRWSEIDRGFEQLHVHPGDPEVIYLAGPGLQIWRSQDRGGRWQRLSNARRGAELHGFSIHAADPSRIYAGLGDGQLWRSDDGGATWNRQSNPAVHPLLGLIADPEDPDLVHASTGGSIYRSSDGGASWRRVVIGEEGSRRTFLATPSGTLILVDNRQLHRSRDRGASWESFEFPAFSSTSIPIFVDPLVASRLYAIASQDLLRSMDEGATWDRVSLPRGAKASSVSFDPRTAGIHYVASDEGVLRSTNGGRTWRRRPTRGLTATDLETVALSPSDPQRVWVLGRGAEEIYRSVDRGVTWERYEVELPPYLFCLAEPSLVAHPNEPQTLHLAMCDRFLRSRDGGATWSELGTVGGEEIRGAVHAPGDPDVLFLATDEGLERWNASSGASGVLEPISLPGTAVPSLRAIATAPGHLAATDGKTLWRSGNDGERWEQVDLAAQLGAYFFPGNLDFDPRAPQRLYMTQTPSTVLRSEDGGTTWENWSDGLEGLRSIFSLAVDPETGAVFVGHSDGVAERAVEGKSWRQRVGNLDRAIFKLAVDRSEGLSVWAATRSGGVQRLSRGEE